MDFHLKTLALDQVAAEKTDALIVLVATAPPAAPASNDALSSMITAARKSGDLADKAGKLLSMYRPPDMAAPRLVLASIGDGDPGSIRTAISAAIHAAKAANPKRMSIVFAQPVDAAGLRSAVITAADASYVYTTTKSKPEPRSIEQLSFGVADSAALRNAFAEARAGLARAA